MISTEMPQMLEKLINFGSALPPNLQNKTNKTQYEKYKSLYYIFLVKTILKQKLLQLPSAKKENSP